MRLSLNQLKEIAHGCCEVREEDRGVMFDRMNAPLRELYSATEGWTTCRRSPAGVRLRFRSNTSRIAVSLRYGRSECPSYCVDLFADDGPLRSAGPEGEAEQWSGEIYAAGTRGERSFDLWMPHVTETWLERLEVDDDAAVTPVAPISGLMRNFAALQMVPPVASSSSTSRQCLPVTSPTMVRTSLLS